MGTMLRCYFMVFAALSGFPGWAAVAGAEGTRAVPANSGMASRELRKSIRMGVEYLLRSQNSNGWWSTSEQPAVTGLALTAIQLAPGSRPDRGRSSELNRGYDYLLSSVKPDGGIYRVGMANYNTSLALMALASAHDEHFQPVITRARRFLANSQIDLGVVGTNDTVFDGGVGYGSKYQHSDMNNTLVAIEAMRFSEVAYRFRDKPGASDTMPDLNWSAVAAFLQNCQNLRSVNAADWVSTDPKDRGGFVYYPGDSKAGAVTNGASGKVALRSYGSISYAGLMSYIHAQVDKNDPRVKAVMEWLRSNYSIAENPGMGQQGYYYYLHLMAKALKAAGVERLKLSSGQEIDWRKEVAGRLIELQKPDGSWVNPETRWWESDPVLVTSYALMTLELIDSGSKN